MYFSFPQVFDPWDISQNWKAIYFWRRVSTVCPPFHGHHKLRKDATILNIEYFASRKSCPDSSWLAFRHTGHRLYGLRCKSIDFRALFLFEAMEFRDFAVYLRTMPARFRFAFFVKWWFNLQPARPWSPSSQLAPFYLQFTAIPHLFPIYCLTSVLLLYCFV